MRERDAPQVLIVGGKGRVGRLLAQCWDGRADVAYQSRSPGADLLWDPADGSQGFRDWADRTGCRAMVVLAGVTPTSGTDFDANARLAEACCRAAAEAGLSQVLYASTSAVYGRGSGRPFTEEDAPDPVGAYGASKLEAEAVCATYRDRDLPVTVLRIGNVAGTDQLLVNAGAATDRAPLKLDRFSDGAGPRRSYIGVSAFSSVIDTLLAADDLPKILNIAAPVPVEMQALLTAAGTPWVWVDAPESAVQDVTLDCGRLETLHDFTPEDADPAAMVADWCRWREQS